MDRALELELRRGYVEAQLGAVTDAGPYAQLEAGYRPLDRLGLYGFGRWTPAQSSAGLGARWTF